MIDWQSQESVVLLNPRTPEELKITLIEALIHYPLYPGHFWLPTSGSSGFPKWVLLSKEAMLISAAAVNRHLETVPADVWMQALPDFHVGGLSIQARCHLSGATYVRCRFPEERWDPHFFVAELTQQRVTLTSLVPAQINDLIAHHLTPPASLRALIVGGGALGQSAYEAAITLGWPLLLTYGLTECASQVATAPLGSTDFPPLHLLSHVQLAIAPNGCLKICSQALFTTYFQFDPSTGWQQCDGKQDGWFTTEDQAVLENGMIRSIVRQGNFVKIGGESVDLRRLEMILEEERLAGGFSFDAALAAVPEERLGHQIVLATTTADQEMSQQLVARYERRVMPYEKVRRIYPITTIPRSALGKVLRTELVRTLI